MSTHFEPEFVREILNDFDETEYNEDFRIRLGASAVFEQAHRFQAEFLDTRLKEEDLIKAWNGAQEFTSSLDIQASEEGLMGQVVTLRGRGIEIPKFETDLSVAASMVTLSRIHEVDEKSLERYYQANDVKGMFSGFTVRFIKTTNDIYIPKLAYQVATNVIDIPHAHINLFSTGIVGQSELTFSEDERKDAIAPFLEQLFALCGERGDSVSLIATALLSTDTYDASIIRHIAYHSEKVLNAVEPEKLMLAEDILIDLLTYYIGTSDPVFIKTSNFLLSAEDATKGAEYYHDEEELYSINGDASGFVFMPQPIIKDGVMTYRDRKQLCVAMTAHAGRTIYTPLTLAQEFTRV